MFAIFLLIDWRRKHELTLKGDYMNCLTGHYPYSNIHLMIREGETKCQIPTKDRTMIRRTLIDLPKEKRSQTS